MAKQNLTEPRVEEFKLTGKSNQSFLRDSKVTGLAVRATAGQKAYIFERRHNRKLHRIVIGDTSSYSLAKAREKARELGVMIDGGNDPQEKKAEQKAKQRREKLTTADAWTAFLEYHEKEWSEVHYNDTLYHSRAPEEGKDAGILWPLLQMKMSDIDARTLVRWAEEAIRVHHQKVEEVKVQRAKTLRKAETLEKQANKLLEQDKPDRAKAVFEQAKILKQKRFSNIRGQNSALRHGYMRFRAFWNWAAQRKEYSGIANPVIFKHSDLKRLLPTSKPKDDVLEKGQLRVWFEAVGQIENPVISAYLQILLLTGARRNELATLKWADVDFKWKAMWIKDKVEEGRKIPLTPYVEYLLDRLPKSETWVFNSPTAKSGHITEPRIAHKRALSIAGLSSDLSLHGLRRSFASLSEWLEMPVGVVAQIMGHKPSATAEKHYKRRPLELLAQWHGSFEKWILENTDIQFNPEAVKEGLQVVK